MDFQSCDGSDAKKRHKQVFVHANCSRSLPKLANQSEETISKQSSRQSNLNDPGYQAKALAVFIAYLTLAKSIESALTSKPQPASHEELIEGRLDTSKLCGLRYSPSQQQQQLGSKNDLFYIVGGDEVFDDQFWPWSVAIYELDPLNGQKAFICSGSLISDKFVLTAAHCIHQSRFDTLSADEVFLKIASVRLDDDRAPFYQVESVHIHPDYNVERKANDIALLKLAGHRLPARARPICLPSQVANRIDFTDQQVTIIGWGKTSAMVGDEPTRLIDTEADRPVSLSANNIELAAGLDNKRRNKKNVKPNENSNDRSESLANDTLLQAQVTVTSTDQCNRNYSKLAISWLNIDEHFLCASDPNGKRDACQGDSGGPLMWNSQHEAGLMMEQEKWYQLGLVSFGHGCANSQYPGVYTRISYYMPWILKIVNNRKYQGSG